MTAQQIASRVVDLWADESAPMIVMTGGEPGLQLDATVIDAMHETRASIHVETNGSILLPDGIDWVTVSPKPPMAVKNQRFDEVKIVFPSVDPGMYANLAIHRYVQPLVGKTAGETRANNAVAVAYVLAHPEWRLSIQAHKFLEIE